MPPERARKDEQAKSLSQSYTGTLSDQCWFPVPDFDRISKPPFVRLYEGRWDMPKLVESTWHNGDA